MYRQILIFICVLVVAGCRTGDERAVSGMAKPVHVAAIGSDCNVVLRSADGIVHSIPKQHYMARAICGSLNAGDVFVPAFSN